MAASLRGGSGTNDPAPGPVYQQAVEGSLNTGQLRGNLLAEGSVVTQVLRLMALDNASGLVDQRVQLRVRANVELLKPIEELRQVADRRVPEDFTLAFRSAAQAFVQVRNQLSDLLEERLFGKLHGLLETGCSPRAFLLI